MPRINLMKIPSQDNLLDMAVYRPIFSATAKILAQKPSYDGMSRFVRILERAMEYPTMKEQDKIILTWIEEEEARKKKEEAEHSQLGKIILFPVGMPHARYAE